MRFVNRLYGFKRRVYDRCKEGGESFKTMKTSGGVLGFPGLLGGKCLGGESKEREQVLYAAPARSKELECQFSGYEKAIFQVLEVRLGFKRGNEERYLLDLLIGDVRKIGHLGANLNVLIHSNKLVNGSFIRAPKSICTKIQGKEVFIIAELLIVKGDESDSMAAAGAADVESGPHPCPLQQDIDEDAQAVCSQGCASDFAFGKAVIPVVSVEESLQIQPYLAVEGVVSSEQWAGFMPSLMQTPLVTIIAVMCPAFGAFSCSSVSWSELPVVQKLPGYPLVTSFPPPGADLCPLQCLPGAVSWEAGLKFNTDGCFYETKKIVGCGGIFSHKEGEWVLGFCEKTEWETSLAAELMGLYMGISIVYDKNMNYIEIESGCIQAIRLIQNMDDDKDHPQQYIIRETRALME